MSEHNTTETKKKTLTLSKGASSQAGGSAGHVRQSFSHGRSKTVTVEVKRRREIQRPGAAASSAAPSSSAATIATPEIPAGLTQAEWESRMRIARKAAQQTRDAEAEQASAPSHAAESEPLSYGARVVAPPPAPEEPFIPLTDLLNPDPEVEMARERAKAKALPDKEVFLSEDDEDEESLSKKDGRKGAATARKGLAPKRRESRLVVHKVLIEEVFESDTLEEPAQPALPRSPLKAKRKEKKAFAPPARVIRDIIIPESITVQELSNRMAVRGAELVKALMKEGMLVTINQSIEGDVAQLLVEQFGHIPKRVNEADVETALEGDVDRPEDLQPRPPVVTIMGHVDHGKTSLLDALRETDVVSKEAGGITQHIGAYQVELPSHKKITFIDTPGHAAFSEMRARGAKVTDIVIVVVAANDGIKEQTVEAINHIKAAGVPMIVAINKMDLPDANADRVRHELLNHSIVVESLGGDTLCVEVSAKARQNLDKLLEAILLQAEMLDLKANPKRPAHGTVIEAQMQHGLGPVATVLVQQGTLKVGDLFVAGTQLGRVRSLLNEKGKKQKQAVPAEPIQVIGFNVVASAGDTLHVVKNEAQAREILDYRIARQKDQQEALQKPKSTSVEDFFEQKGDHKELAVIIKADVHGSLEAIQSSLLKVATDEASIRILHAGVGAITESDVILASASKAIIIGFNVRANPQAKKLVERDQALLRYYAIIYNVIDDMKALLGGMLAPTIHEEYIGQAEIRNVFNITKSGKVAGCMVTDGFVKRGAKLRLLRDNVVIHEGPLKTLKRFKDEVKEVRQGYECGMAFENYQDIREGDIIECFETKEVARTL